MLRLAALGLLSLSQTTTPSEALATRLETALEAYLAAGHAPGISCGVARAGESLALAAGRRDPRREDELTPDDLLCAGSTGKTFVAALVLSLVAEGKLALDTLAGEYLGEEPWFARLPGADELDVERLLSHRTGLPRYEFQPAFARDLLAQPDHVWTPPELLAYVLDQEPLCAPGEGFAYADTNYIVLGMLFERVSGQSLYAEAERRLLRPLGLAHVRPQDGRRIPGLVQGHAGARDPLGFPEFVLDDQGLFCTNPQFEWAGGGFVSSAGDLARWGRALYGGDVLPRAWRERMLAGHPAPELGRDVGYGLGAITWTTRHGPAVGHEGFFPGYLTCLRYWPEHDVALALQVNTSVFADLPRPLTRLSDELLALVLAP